MSGATTASGFMANVGRVASGVNTVAQAGLAGVGAGVTTDSFIGGMTLLQEQTNKIQLTMGQLNLQKTCVEGFAKFLKEMGKGFVMQ